MKVEKHEFDDSVVTLDTYNSDLNLAIDGSRYSAHPLTVQGFAFMWAGARATHGVSKGKICYEVKVVKQLDVSHLPSDEPNPHVVRVGFSVENTTLQLGEDPLSYGYGGTGKVSTNCQFKDFGASFGEDDHIMAFLNMDADTVDIGFAKNGKFLGWAYKVNRGQLGNKALYPHILTKNCSFEVNFGQRDKPMSSVPASFEAYTFISCVPGDLRERGTRVPERREDCEMIMMCGLPGAGKSVWAADYSAKNLQKKYNVLGTNNIIDKMKVMGLPRKRNYHGRWDVLIQMATKCLNKMFEIGSKLRRNYILDQTNVYPTAQRRKMRNFEGFQRSAVVVVPTDEEFKCRCGKREKEEGKEIPDHAVLEMKANFKLPEVCDIFEKVIFTDLQQNEAETLVRTYNEEGRAAVGPTTKRFRPNEPSPGGRNFNNSGSSRDNSSGFGGSPGRNSWSDNSSGFENSSSIRGNYGGSPNYRGSGRGGYDGGSSRGRGFNEPSHRGGYGSGGDHSQGGFGGNNYGRGGGSRGKGGHPESGFGRDQGYDSGQDGSIYTGYGSEGGNGGGRGTRGFGGRGGGSNRGFGSERGFGGGRGGGGDRGNSRGYGGRGRASGYGNYGDDFNKRSDDISSGGYGSDGLLGSYGERDSGFPGEQSGRGLLGSYGSSGTYEDGSSGAHGSGHSGYGSGEPSASYSGGRSGNVNKGAGYGSFNKDAGYGSGGSASFNKDEGYGGSGSAGGFNKDGYGSGGSAGGFNKDGRYGSGGSTGGFNKDGGYGSGGSTSGFNKDGGYGSGSAGGFNKDGGYGSGGSAGGFNKDGGYGSDVSSGVFNKGGSYGGRGNGGRGSRGGANRGFSGSQNNSGGISHRSDGNRNWSNSTSTQQSGAQSDYQGGYDNNVADSKSGNNSRSSYGSYDQSYGSSYETQSQGYQQYGYQSQANQNPATQPWAPSNPTAVAVPPQAAAQPAQSQWTQYYQQQQQPQQQYYNQYYGQQGSASTTAPVYGTGAYAAK